MPENNNQKINCTKNQGEEQKYPNNDPMNILGSFLLSFLLLLLGSLLLFDYLEKEYFTLRTYVYKSGTAILAISVLYFGTILFFYLGIHNYKRRRKLKGFLYEKYSDVFSFIDEIITKSPEPFEGKSVNSLEEKITLFHYARSLYLLKSIKLLCSEGYATEAMIILRSLLNLFINIRWLTSKDIDYCDTEYRMERFAEYDVIFKKKHQDNIIEFCPGVINEDESTFFNDEFDRIKKKYPKEKKFDPRFWSGRNIFDMSKEVSQESRYRIIYSELCELEHTGPSSKNEYIDFSDKGKMKINIGPRDKHITKVLLTAIEYFIDVNAITHLVFNLELADLERNKKKLDVLEKKYWKS